jgi:hypothetical protein
MKLKLKLKLQFQYYSNILYIIKYLWDLHFDLYYIRGSHTDHSVYHRR